jgi:hypothetical protein
MKKILYIGLVSILSFSCEDPIDVNLDTAAPKLVIDASINWFKGTSGNIQEIKLSLTAPYFNLSVPPANNAIVSVTDQNNTTFNFVEDAASGIYRTDSFMPVIDGIYDLTIEYNGETYTATETLKSVSSVEFVEQINDGGFSGDETEIKAYYTDPGNETNYYFFEFINNIPTIPTLEVYDDEFTNGNQIFAFYSEEDLRPGNELLITNYGVSERFYEFMFILLQQGGSEAGSPFEVQPSTVRGNCKNDTNPSNFPLGYFRLSQADTFSYTIE